LQNGFDRLPNYAWVMEKIIEEVGADTFWERYPNLRDVHAALTLDSDVGDGETESLCNPAAGAVFRAIRADCPAQPMLIDVLLLNAARLDLHGTAVSSDHRYRDDESEHDRALLAGIGERMNLPFDTANYLCHLSNTYKYLYVATPKAACTAIKHCLQQAEMAGTLVFRDYGEEHKPTLSPLLAPIHSPQVYFDAFGVDDWFRFTFVREPFGRALSCYLDKIVNSAGERNRLLPRLGLDPNAGIPSFADFLNAVARYPVEEHDLHWAPQSWLTQPDTVKYHFIGRLENFETDFQHVCDRLGIKMQSQSGRHSTRADEKLAAYYGAEEIELARSIYAQDFIGFGYDSNLLTARSRPQAEPD
jgi:hypothetical protein